MQAEKVSSSLYKTTTPLLEQLGPQELLIPLKRNNFSLCTIMGGSSPVVKVFGLPSQDLNQDHCWPRGCAILTRSTTGGLFLKTVCFAQKHKQGLVFIRISENHSYIYIYSYDIK